MDDGRGTTLEPSHGYEWTPMDIDVHKRDAAGPRLFEPKVSFHVRKVSPCHQHLSVAGPCLPILFFPLPPGLLSLPIRFRVS